MHPFANEVKTAKDVIPFVGFNAPARATITFVPDEDQVAVLAATRFLPTRAFRQQV